MDRISNLPPCIIETILCLLPIQEAGRTSILSRDWRYHWTKIPKLEFFEDKFQVLTELSVLEQMHHKPRERRNRAKSHKLFSAIHQVLLMHQRPIHEFTLEISMYDSCAEMNPIIHHLSRENTVKMIRLDLKDLYEDLSVSLLSLHQLRDLCFTGCDLDLHPSFNGFGSLTNLHLEQASTGETTLLRLLSGCPLLKRLTLDCECSNHSDPKQYTIVDLIKCLPPLIEQLSMSCDIAWAFDPIEGPKELPTVFVHLKYFCMTDTDIVGLPFIILMIRSSPNLEKLKLKMEDVECQCDLDSVPLNDRSNILLEHLNELEIEDFSIKEAFLLDFLKLIMAKSPVLEEVKINLQRVRRNVQNKDELQLSEILSNFPKASPTPNGTLLL